jgi:hypothetical protein
MKNSKHQINTFLEKEELLNQSEFCKLHLGHQTWTLLFCPGLTPAVATISLKMSIAAIP